MDINFVFGNAAVVGREVPTFLAVGGVLRGRGGWTVTGSSSRSRRSATGSSPGAGTAGRVRWLGYSVITDRSVAVQFTMGQFFQSDAWLNGTGVDYDKGLCKLRSLVKTCFNIRHAE
ncbi:hypothetical protein PR202_ga09406 [Eleusine coracana subsp. coracana]|uniref:Pectinesterase n=1 Tax=Eleusine coracana subsp. coracana TaxID=191504 RepID=A0AAV5C4K9_ELECO|nr:hypothetical protein PR202_ga09406 [Eleusine coracana subsp. coracana]